MRAVYVNYSQKKVIKAEQREETISALEKNNLENIFIKRQFLNDTYGSLFSFYEALEKGLTFEDTQEAFRKYCRIRAAHDFAEQWTREEI